MWTNSPKHMIKNHINCVCCSLNENHKDWKRGKYGDEVFKKMCQFFKTEIIIKNGTFNNTTQSHFFSNSLIDLDFAKDIPQESMNGIIQYESQREAEICNKRSLQYCSIKNGK